MDFVQYERQPVNPTEESTDPFAFQVWGRRFITPPCDEVRLAYTF